MEYLGPARLHSRSLSRGQHDDCEASATLRAIQIRHAGRVPHPSRFSSVFFGQKRIEAKPVTLWSLPRPLPSAPLAISGPDRLRIVPIPAGRKTMVIVTPGGLRVWSWEWGGLQACAPQERPIQIYGNTQGLKANQARQLERLFRRRLPADRLITNDFARALSEVSRETRRQVGVLVDRRGDVSHVMVGNAHSIELPDWGRLRAAPGRLRGLRCIHTHLAGEALTRDDMTDLALLRLDAMVTLEVLEDGLPGIAYTASLRPSSRDLEQDGSDGTEQLKPARAADLDFDFLDWIRNLEEELNQNQSTRAVGDGERALLVSVHGWPAA